MVFYILTNQASRVYSALSRRAGADSNNLQALFANLKRRQLCLHVCEDRHMPSRSWYSTGLLCREQHALNLKVTRVEKKCVLCKIFAYVACVCGSPSFHGTLAVFTEICKAFKHVIKNSIYIFIMLSWHLTQAQAPFLRWQLMRSVCMQGIWTNSCIKGHVLYT